MSSISSFPLLFLNIFFLSPALLQPGLFIQHYEAFPHILKPNQQQDMKGNFPAPVAPLVTANMKQDSPMQSVNNPQAEITETVHYLCNSFCYCPSISACLKALMILLAKPLHLSLNSSSNNTDGLSDL